MPTQPPRSKQPRNKSRATVDAHVTTRRPGFHNFKVRICDLSEDGCRIEFVDRPKVGERIWVKLEGLEAIEATICWVKSGLAGARFERPLHPAVFDLLLKRLGGTGS